MNIGPSNKTPPTGHARVLVILLVMCGIVFAVAMLSLYLTKKHKGAALAQ